MTCCLPAVELHQRLLAGELEDLAIHPRAHEALALQLFEHIAKFADLPLHDRREQHSRVSGGQLQDAVDDLLRARASRSACPVAGIVRLAGRGEKQPEVIVNLRGGGDGRARVAAGAALLDRDGRREALDEIDVRLLHLVEKLPGIDGKALDIAPLPLGVEGIEGQATTCPSRSAR